MHIPYAQNLLSQIEQLSTLYKIVANQITNSIQSMLKNRIEKTLYDVPQQLLASIPLLQKMFEVHKVINELKLPEDLLYNAVDEALKLIQNVCTMGCEYKYFTIEAYEDVELEEWKGIVLKFVLKGDYKILLRVWSEISKKVSRILASHSKYVYVVVEPYE